MGCVCVTEVYAPALFILTRPFLGAVLLLFFLKKKFESLRMNACPRKLSLLA